MKNKTFFKQILLLLILFLYTKSSPNQPIYPLKLNIPEKGSLNDNSYMFYKLTLNEISQNIKENLIIRADEDKSVTSDNNIQYHFSDPDLFVSKTNKYPKDPETSTWYCNEFGNDIVAISKDYI